MSCIFACSGVREAFWLLQRRQAATTFVQMSVPCWLNGRMWSRDSSRAAKRMPQYMHRKASRRHVIMTGVAGVAGMPDGCDDGIHLEHRAPAGAGVHAAIELIKERATGIRHLLLMVEPGGLAVIDPLE